MHNILTPEQRARRLSLREQLMAAGEERQALRDAQQRLRARLGVLVHEAVEAGWGITTIANWLGVNPKTAYVLLDGHKQTLAAEDG